MLFSNIKIQMKEDMLSNKSRGPLRSTTTTTSSFPQSVSLKQKIFLSAFLEEKLKI